MKLLLIQQELTEEDGKTFSKCKRIDLTDEFSVIISISLKIGARDNVSIYGNAEFICNNQ